MKVGPESAGANPGPACYGRGGTLPTVTDANIYLGKLNQQKILGGRMEVYLDRAERAIREQLCEPAQLEMQEAANGVISVVNSNMIRAIRLVSVEKGYDVREFSLMAFGGAGPLHACEVAQEMDIRSVLIPPSPGTLCSLGLLMADTRFDFCRTRMMDAVSGKSWRSGGNLSGDGDRRRRHARQRGHRQRYSNLRMVGGHALRPSKLRNYGAAEIALL